MIRLIAILICSLLGPVFLGAQERVSNTDARIVGWASGVAGYQVGSSADAMWQDTAQALGPAEGNSFDIVSLGRGGLITLTFDAPIRDLEGPDFAVFENAFNDTFLELAFVEVSNGGGSFTRFPVRSRTAAAVSTYGALDPSLIEGFAGSVRQGFGTPFDLDELGLTQITHIRLIDVIGDGRHRDADGRPIYDPYPTFGSAGFDLDGIAVLEPGTLTNFARAAGGFNLFFDTALGSEYTVEFATTLEPGLPNQWQAYAAPIIGTGAAKSLLIHNTMPLAFVRVRRRDL